MRLIDADKLIAQWEEDAKHMDDVTCQMMTYGAINDVKKQPAIDIVRCGECKYSETYITDVDGEIIFCWKENALYRQVTAEDFCSKGRRK